jgi:hypothetical protein
MNVVVLGLLALLLAAGPAISQPVDDRLIVPGVRIGKWTLTMTIDDLVRMNGPAQTLDEDDPDFIRRIYEFHWFKPGLSLTAITFDRQRVDVLLFNAVPIEATVYKTARGVGFLSTRQDVLRLYGQPTIAKAGRMLGTTNMIYDGFGINFQVDDNNKGLVTLVAIFRPTSAKGIWKF